MAATPAFRAFVEQSNDIPVEASRKLLRVMDEDDISIEAILTKLEYAHFQVKALCERVRNIEEKQLANSA